uniref:Uncharacterized protein n=1 Tax=Caenorhabditis japonica TaxID=281687 RepID=A0A8R1HNZ9_CAEJA
MIDWVLLYSGRPSGSGINQRNKKAPSLDEQPRGENGRIIFTQEYIDYMLYRDLQPLVDLRVLKKTEEVIMRKINERDTAKNVTAEPTKNKTEPPAVRVGRARQVIRKFAKWTIDLSRHYGVKLGRFTRKS